MTTDKQSMYLPCPKCGGEQVHNPHTGKIFCKAKCWLNAPVSEGTETGAKTLTYPQVERVVKQGFVAKDSKPKFDTSSYFVAYSKDLCIAMLQANASAVVAGKAEPVNIGALMHDAIVCIQAAKKEFE